MAIAANRHAGVRAVVCSDTYTAQAQPPHNDANVLCIGERVVGSGLGVGDRVGLARGARVHG